jgi:hypothetical protein
MIDDDQWIADDVAYRFREAVLTLKKLPPVRVQGYFTVWPAIKLTPLEILQQDKKPMRLLAMPEAITRLDEVLTWLPWLSVDERRLVWQRAARVRWKTICSELGCTRATAWRLWITALEKIAACLNNQRNR